MVETTSDVFKLEENKEQFINTPLKDLLKKINPEIKTAVIFDNGESSVFIFRLTSLYKQKDEPIVHGLSLLVFVKQKIPSNWKGRGEGSELNWTESDTRKFDDFTILNIRVASSCEMTIY